MAYCINHPSGGNSMKDLADLHTHTIASGHAYATLCEMAHSAAQKELPILGISDHAPSMPGSSQEIYFRNFQVVPDEIEGVRILCGCELNILDYEGRIDLTERTLSRLDYTIASLHDLCTAPGSVEQNTAAYIGASKNPHVVIIGHPDDGRFPADYESIVKAAKEHHTLIELNNSSFIPNTSRVNTRENSLTILRYCKKYRTPVIISSDAHFVCDVANHRLSLELLASVDFPDSLVANYSASLLAEYIPALRPEKNSDV
jgi:putative hydrolase